MKRDIHAGLHDGGLVHLVPLVQALLVQALLVLVLPAHVVALAPLHPVLAQKGQAKVGGVHPLTSQSQLKVYMTSTPHLHLRLRPRLQWSHPSPEKPMPDVLPQPLLPQPSSDNSAQAIPKGQKFRSLLLSFQA